MVPPCVTLTAWGGAAESSKPTTASEREPLMTFYKATRPDGTDFRTGTVRYADALGAGDVVSHPSKRQQMIPDEPGTYLSVSVEPAETLIGGSWPCRLFVVDPVGPVLDGLSASRYKRACLSLRVVEELPAWQALGPNGQRVAVVIERARTLTHDEAKRLGAARGAARDAARDAAWRAARRAAWDAARGAARDAALEAAWDAAWDAALAELVHDLLTDPDYRRLAGPWLDVIGDPSGCP